MLFVMPTIKYEIGQALSVRQSQRFKDGSVKVLKATLKTECVSFSSTLIPLEGKKELSIEMEVFEGSDISLTSDIYTYCKKEGFEKGFNFVQKLSSFGNMQKTGVFTFEPSVMPDTVFSCLALTGSKGSKKDVIYNFLYKTSGLLVDDVPTTKLQRLYPLIDSLSTELEKSVYNAIKDVKSKELSVTLDVYRTFKSIAWNSQRDDNGRMTFEMKENVSMFIDLLYTNDIMQFHFFTCENVFNVLGMFKRGLIYAKQVQAKQSKGLTYHAMDNSYSDYEELCQNWISTAMENDSIFMIDMLEYLKSQSKKYDYVTWFNMYYMHDTDFKKCIKIANVSNTTFYKFVDIVKEYVLKNDESFVRFEHHAKKFK